MVQLQKLATEASPGLPLPVRTGGFDGSPYLVMPLLGTSLADEFPRIRRLPFDQRWRLVCVVGRMLLRRLETVHRCGFVHCDLSPENVLYGPPSADSWGEPETLFLVDFGLAQRWPGGGCLRGDRGSAEWSSIRSADGGERSPDDDLEALG